MNNAERFADLAGKYGSEIFDKFIAILILAGKDATQIKALWDLWED